MSENGSTRGKNDYPAAAAAAGGALKQLAASPNERRERMLALIKEREFVRVGELSNQFGISEVTVRNDLAALAEQGQIHRIRGGAIPRATLGQERPFEESKTSFAAEKLAIGRAAAELVGTAGFLSSSMSVPPPSQRPVLSLHAASFVTSSCSRTVSRPHSPSSLPSHVYP